jgi:hypothetical protein
MMCLPSSLFQVQPLDIAEILSWASYSFDRGTLGHMSLYERTAS